jgi:cyclopropane-fatty-acyl-phospholipid synthase
MEERLNQLARRLFCSTLAALRDCALEVACPDATYRFGDPQHPLRATIAVHHPRFFRRAVLNGDVGIGESYMDGDWSTPDLVAVIRAGVRNIGRLMSSHSALSLVHRITDQLAHRFRPNTVTGSRRNIAYHYDLGNDFYRLFLDPSLAYSCAYYRTPEDTLEQAQQQKFEIICRKLELSSHHHLLEIGTGWGGLAAYAATHYGCHVTTTTISRQQHDYAAALFEPLRRQGARIELLFEDYRKLTGQFDRIVSIEMFEAVGYRYYDAFFGACNRLLRAGGLMLLQTITLREQEFPSYLYRSDWIRKHIFPGSELASLAGITRSLGRVTQLAALHLEDIGWHYSETLAEWRRRFNAHRDEVLRLGFDERFFRMWDYYLAYCDAAFRERYIGDAQLVLAKAGALTPLFTDPHPHSVSRQGEPVPVR